MGWVRGARSLATPATFLLSSNDPSGFNLIDVLAYGALGHAFGYFILATNSLQVSCDGLHVLQAQAI